jgi:hypothetical protein
MKYHVLEIERNAEGSLLAYLSKEGESCGFRIAGPKAWGGSKNIARLKISDNDLFRYIKGYAPEVHEMLKAL